METRVAVRVAVVASPLSLSRVTAAALALALLPAVSGGQAEPEARGLAPISDPRLVAIADRLLESFELPRYRDFELYASFAPGSEVGGEDGTVQVDLEAIVAVPPHWRAGRRLRVAVVAYGLDEEPRVFDELVDLGDMAQAAWWAYRRTLTLAEEFLEAVVIVEDPAADLRSGTRVGYGEIVVGQRRTAVVVDELEPLPSSIAPATPARPSIIRLIAPVGNAHVGRVRIRTLASSEEVAEVVFELDGAPVGTDSRKPFTVELELGPEPRSRELAATALAADGRQLGSDRILLNPELELFDVRLIELRSEGAEIVAEAVVTVPRDAVLERVEFFRNEERLTTRDAEPFRATISATDIGSDDYVRVVAYLEDGRSLEDVVLAAATDSGVELDVNLVEIFAVATDRSGEPLSDLTEKDFEVRLRGREVAIDRFERAVDVPLSLGLVLDTSGSMITLMPDAKRAGARFLSAVLKEGDQAFLVDFDTRPRLAHPLTDDVGSLLRRFGTLEPEGNTALYDAIVFGSLQFEGTRGRRALVVLTDGEAFGGQFGARDSAKHAIGQAAPVYVIDMSGVFGGTGTPKLSLVGLAKTTGGWVHTVPAVDPMAQDYERVRQSLEEAYDRIQRELRSQYVLAFSTETPLTADELQRIDVKVKRPRVKVRRVVGTAAG